MTSLRNVLCAAAFTLLSFTTLYAASPLWVFSALTPTQIVVSTESTATIKYIVTNLSSKPKNLVMKSLPGVSASPCLLSSKGSSCTLILTINGNQVPQQGIISGPILCEQGNPAQCYQPRLNNQLKISTHSFGINYLVTAIGDAHVHVVPTQQQVASGQQATIAVAVDPNYEAVGSGCGGVLNGNTYTTSAITAPCTVTFTSVALYTVSAIGDAHVSVNPNQQNVFSGQQAIINVTLEPNYTVSGSGCGGTLNGTTYTTAPVTASCTVNFISSMPNFALAQAPTHIIGVPGNGQVTLSWTAPTNTGQGTITGYNVTYGLTNGTSFTTQACSTTNTSCTITGLTNNSSYTFAVSAVTAQKGTGARGLSSPITPVAGITANPSVLAVSGLGGGATRSIALINTTANSITLDSFNFDFTPSLPSGTNLGLSFQCTQPIPSGGSCSLLVLPGTSVSNDSNGNPCTNGTAPLVSTATVSANSGTYTTALNVVVLGYGCQYQGGYLFAIDDSTNTIGSIGGKVAMTINKANSWSPNGASDSIWGIDERSNPQNPNPNPASIFPAVNVQGQLNCDGAVDGSCNTKNIRAYYGPSVNNYATQYCVQALDNNANTCLGGANCYTDWYLPAVCELGYDSNNSNSTCGASPGIIQNMQYNLLDRTGSNIAGLLVDQGIASSYLSSTEVFANPQLNIWNQVFGLNTNSSQIANGVKNGGNATTYRCVRQLTE